MDTFYRTLSRGTSRGRNNRSVLLSADGRLWPPTHLALAEIVWQGCVNTMALYKYHERRSGPRSVWFAAPGDSPQVHAGPAILTRLSALLTLELPRRR